MVVFLSLAYSLNTLICNSNHFLAADIIFLFFMDENEALCVYAYMAHILSTMEGRPA